MENNPIAKKLKRDFFMFISIFFVKNKANSNNFHKEIEKCDVLCANCHREIHSPDSKIENVRFITEHNENILKTRSINKPKCVDCNHEIGYGTQRCKICYAKYRRIVERPEKDVLNEDVKNFGYHGTGKKYGVSGKTVKKWIRAYIASHS